jgi:hypothetical protein
MTDCSHFRPAQKTWLILILFCNSMSHWWLKVLKNRNKPTVIASLSRYVGSRLTSSDVRVKFTVKLSFWWRKAEEPVFFSGLESFHPPTVYIRGRSVASVRHTFTGSMWKHSKICPFLAVVHSHGPMLVEKWAFIPEFAVIFGTNVGFGQKRGLMWTNTYYWNFGEQKIANYVV